MEISIKLHANLSQYTPDNSNCYHVSAHSNISDVLDRLRVPGKWRKMLLVFVNNAIVQDLSRELEHGDEVKVFLVLGGG